MWRSETEVALNDLVEATREAADLYSDDSEVLAEDHLGRLFDELAERRDRFAILLSEQIRRGGDLPAAPDADRETLRRLGNRLRAALSADERQALVMERISAEESLHRLIERALAQPVEPAVRTLLTEFGRDSRSARALLEAQLPR